MIKWGENQASSSGKNLSEILTTEIRQLIRLPYLSNDFLVEKVFPLNLFPSELLFMSSVYKTSPEKCTGIQYFPRKPDFSVIGTKFKNVPILISSRGISGRKGPPPQEYETPLGEVVIDEEGYQRWYFGVFFSFNLFPRNIFSYFF